MIDVGEPAEKLPSPIIPAIAPTKRNTILTRQITTDLNDLPYAENGPSI